MLKIYTNKTFLTEAYRKKVFPLLFDLCYLKHKGLVEYFSLVEEAKDCDIMIMPIDYAKFIKHQKAFDTLLMLSKTYKMPLWIYTAGDYGFTNSIENAYTFRLGGFKSQLPKHTFVMPSFINDPYDMVLEYRGFVAVKKAEKPSIGFVGHAQSGILKYTKELVNHLKFHATRQAYRLTVDSQSFFPSSIKRAKLLRKLEQSQSLKTNFILRNKYRGDLSIEEGKKLTEKEFFQNIYVNAYTFCIRGRGNFSVRFYETLAVGRIPILLDTDCKLPLEDSIDWNKHVVILNSQSPDSLENQILNFHNSLTAEEFEALQASNRHLWLNYLRREEYFKIVCKVF
ncbi:exostosin domain-containing protein [Pseudotamlana agarivorans]|uniref:exostosin domain-containing protein n=1 Tax=Pseudotamlana agarivorans TaxID=481183 RepID=UPI00082C0045|nr:exostosin family protein [Tamlana agarivorans]